MLAWAWNRHADRRLRDACAGGGRTLAELILVRLRQNADDRAAVRALAREDAWHPVDTLRRTRSTARLMWRLLGRRRARGTRAVLADAALVVVYTAAVGWWLLDVDASRTERAVCRLTGLLPSAWRHLPPAPPQLLEALYPRVAAHGWTRPVLDAASAAGCADPFFWRRRFGGSITRVLADVSRDSDTRMAAEAARRVGLDLHGIFMLRFEQNRHLKPFVRQVMRYDLRHPVQALRRMQRTAAVMWNGIGQPERGRRWWDRARLNLVYTAVVFRWLAESGDGHRRTGAFARMLLRTLRMA